jgi:hypothetical protein
MVPGFFENDNHQATVIPNIKQGYLLISYLFFHRIKSIGCIQMLYGWQQTASRWKLRGFIRGSIVLSLLPDIPPLPVALTLIVIKKKRDPGFCCAEEPAH